MALDIFIIRQLLLHFAQLALQLVNLLFVFGIALGVAGEGGQPVADLLRSPVGGGKDGTQYAALGGLAVAGGCRNEHTQHQECCQYAYGLNRAAFPKCFHYLALLSLMEVPIATQSVGASGM